jgi:hypothetical protein
MRISFSPHHERKRKITSAKNKPMKNPQCKLKRRPTSPKAMKNKK